MDNRPIGFFDSGLGGLTCITYLMRELPDERVVYFGDTARTPYGSKAEHTIVNFSRQISDFLVKQDVKMIVIACNTVSAICLDDIRRRHPDIPIVGIIEPTAKHIASNYTDSDKVGIIGTKVTIASHSYRDEIASYNGKAQVEELACPVFVPLIEEGIVEGDIMELTIKHYLDDFIEKKGINTLVLGCTHYPIIKNQIEGIYPRLEIINPSKIVVEAIRDELEKRDAFAISGDKEENLFYASDLSDNFLRMIDRIFDESSKKVAFKNLDI